MVLAAGELTKRSPLGAYAIIRGAWSSAYVVTVKPAGTVGMTASGFGTLRPGFGVPVPGAGSASARGCGTEEFCCATRPTADIAASDAINKVRFIPSPSQGPPPQLQRRRVSTPYCRRSFGGC